FGDVLEVLGRNDVFSVQPYAEAMTRINRGPNFLLGMEDGPEYRQQLSILGRAVHRNDADRVRELISARTAELLGPALVEGRLELTDGFGRMIPTLFVGDYFGVPGPDAATLMKWARAIFADAFVNVLREPLLSRRAMEASGEFRTYLDGLIDRIKAGRQRGAAARDDVIGRLITLQESTEPGLSDAGVRDSLLWCVAGMLDNINTAVSNAMYFFLSHTDILKGAVDAAVAADRELVRKHALEALRFRTPTPVVARLSLHEHTLSKGTGHEKTIPAGTRVFAGMGSAMMDRTAVDSPRQFRLDRPPHQYLHFGAGLHQCLGTHLADAHLTEIIGSLLKLPGIRRARGLAGRLQYAGAFPKKFVAEFDPSGIAV
ncbi:MAG TPA: cytochrome P450, partial [Longimicrobiales bacterium]|nr:cytochrome P450 [Longimicrobiales bacterium]